jgi:hypothetical protein
MIAQLNQINDKFEYRCLLSTTSSAFWEFLV